MSAKSPDCDRAMGLSDEPKHIQTDYKNHIKSDG